MRNPSYRETKAYQHSPIPSLMAGDIGFVFHTGNPISRLIAWFMKSRFSHSFLVYGTLRDQTLVVETSDFEVVISTFDRYLADPRCRIEVYRPTTPGKPQRDLAARHASELLGTTYGYLQLLSLGLRRILRRLGVRIPNFIRQGVVCTAVPLYGWHGLGLPVLSQIDPESIDTEELHHILTQMPASYSLVYQREAL